MALPAEEELKRSVRGFWTVMANGKDQRYHVQSERKKRRYKTIIVAWDMNFQDV